MLRDPSQRILAAAAATLAVHIVLGVVVEAAERPERVPPPARERTQKIRSVSFDVELPKKLEPIPVVLPPKPKPPEPKPPEPPPKPVVEKKKEPPPKVPQKDKPARTETRTKKKLVKKRGQAKTTKKRKEASKVDDKPPPLVLDKKYLAKKGAVTVYGGEEDLFGKPDVKPTEDNVKVDKVDDPKKAPKAFGDGRPGGGGPKYTPARIKKKFKGGQWPDDAPMLGRVVRVQLSLLVGKDGRVTQVRVVQGAGDAFNRAAKREGKRQLFHPQLRDGAPVAGWVPWRVEFRPRG